MRSPPPLSPPDDPEQPRTDAAILAVEGAPIQVDVSEVEARNAFAAKLNATAETAFVATFGAQAERRAYVTMATPDYRFGLLAWLRSLRKYSQRPAIVLVNGPMETPTGFDNVVFVAVPRLIHDDFRSHRAEFRNVLTKLWAFDLTFLDRMIFVDVDCLFQASVDDLFARQQFLVAPDWVEDRKSQRFNTGVMALSPNEALRDRIFLQIPQVESYDGGDQGALNTILENEVTFVGPDYNLLRHFHYFADAATASQAKIIHYIVKKPWDLLYRETPDAMLVGLDDLWTHALSHEELLELAAHWRRSVFFQSERARIESLGGPQVQAAHQRADRLEQHLASLERRHRNASAWLVVMAALALAAGVAALAITWGAAWR